MTGAEVMIDDVDRLILASLQVDARVSFRQLAKKVHMSPAAVTTRVHALEQAGLIRGYRAQLDPEKLGRGTRAFIRLTAVSSTTRSVQSAEQIARDHPAVREVFLLLGDSDVVVYVEATDLQELDALVTALGSFGQTTTTLIVETLLSRDVRVDA